MSRPDLARTSRRTSRRAVVLGAVLVALLGLLTTCVVVAQTRYQPGSPLGGAAPAPSRASLPATSNAATPSASPHPVNSGPPARAWRTFSWRSAVHSNGIIAMRYPPRPSGRLARKDPLRAAVALLTVLDGTNPRAWRAGADPASPYVTAALDGVYGPASPRPSRSPAEDPGDVGPDKVPKGATAAYEFYCHVPAHHRRTVIVDCGYHVRVATASGAVVREEDSIGRRLTVVHGGDGWRVSRVVARGQRGD